jgi:predicted ATP-dependent endonuclease of OLD family
MKIKALKVQKAYGHLNLNLKFPSGLSFLIGINGSGKTTAIKLIEAILTPSLEQLDKIPHTSATLRLEVSGKTVSITTSVYNGKTTIKIPSLGEGSVFSYELPDFSAPISRETQAKDTLSAAYASITAQNLNNPVLGYLHKELDMPLFLGLERRNVANHFWQSSEITDPIQYRMALRKRDILINSVRRRIPEISGVLGSRLIDVQIVIQEIFSELRVEQERFATQLREQILLDAFDYQLSTTFMQSVKQNIRAIKQIAEKRKHVENALRKAGLADDNFKPLVNKFYEDISKLAHSNSSPTSHEELLELALNKPVVDRVNKLIASSERYNGEINKLWNPITRFIELVNRFFADSGKKLAIDEIGWLYIDMGDKSGPQPLEILSSGERQLFVIFGHLAINREIKKAGIFVIDEPEISLHLKWQEIFVSSILEANTGNQFILATHSPAIVLDRDDRCLLLDQQG